MIFFAGSWQIGCEMNQYVKQLLSEHGIENFTHKARQISYLDFSKFDIIIGMDYFHVKELNDAVEALKSNVRVELLGNFERNENIDKSIHDPICGDLSVFKSCYDRISVCCENLLDEILNGKLN
jgi:protein-tyrosine-phosphatase